ncbi:MAG TPA: hypothetical protein PKI19_00080 [Elusimicrobiales bacterium]|nr:hypothetical protein [Elusimicrobiales bacterium]
MKKTSILIAIFAVMTAASMARAEEMQIDFDRGGNLTSSLDGFKKALSDFETVALPIPTVSAFLETNKVEPGTKESPMRSKQQLIKDIVASYNTQRLHDDSIEKNLKIEGVIITLKLPNQILIMKDGETLNTIDNEILLNTIRYNLSANGATKGKCVTWILTTVATWVVDHFIDQVVKVCSEYEPTPTPPSNSGGGGSGGGGGAALHPLPINPPVRK